MNPPTHEDYSPKYLLSPSIYFMYARSSSPLIFQLISYPYFLFYRDNMMVQWKKLEECVSLDINMSP